MDGLIGGLAEQLSKIGDKRMNMLVGIDGFVDEIIQVVDTRQDHKNYIPMRKIEDFGKRVMRAAGLSTNMEFVTTQFKLGGNGPIFSNALIEYGADLSYFGCLGVPEVHPVFRRMSDRCRRVYSICGPGYSDALEFDDGKLIFGKHSTLKEITWERVKEIFGGLTSFAAEVSACDVFGMENWTMIPHMSEIWKGIIREVFPVLPKKSVKPIVFFDLADPEKRTVKDILEALLLISTFEQKFRVILGLNEKELFEIAGVLDVAPDGAADRLVMMKSVISEVYEKLNISCLVVHPVKEAMACVNGDFYYTDGPYCEAPVLTTGAGDNFNAGFVFGQALGLDPHSSLLLGVATSGFYVRNARSPQINEQIAFLKKWEQNAL